MSKPSVSDQLIESRKARLELERHRTINCIVRWTAGVLVVNAVAFMVTSVILILTGHSDEIAKLQPIVAVMVPSLTAATTAAYGLLALKRKD